jgi:uncharacterized iron-regulated membrane protein
MQFDDRPRLGYRGNLRSRAQNVIAKTLAAGAAGVMLLSAIALSLVFFAVALAGVAVFGLYLWWKTRAVRKTMRSAPIDDDVIDGVIVREVEIRRIEHR